MPRTKALYEARVPVTHNRGDLHSEWLISVTKHGRTYSVCCTEYCFCSIDNRVVGAIFSPHKDLLRQAFYGWYELGLVTKNATWSNVASANSYLSGIKTEDTALEVMEWFERLARRTLASIPKKDLDRNLLLAVDVKIVAIEKAREFSSSIQDEIMKKLNDIGCHDTI